MERGVPVTATCGYNFIYSYVVPANNCNFPWATPRPVSFALMVKYCRAGPLTTEILLNISEHQSPYMELTGHVQRKLHTPQEEWHQEDK
jgi:hypothetical protein